MSTNDPLSPIRLQLMWDRLIAVVEGCARRPVFQVASAVAAYITAAYWFTSSTSFANPAITLARSASNTFSGIRPVDAPAFVGAQILGAAAATALFRWFFATMPEASEQRTSSAVPSESEITS